MKTSQRVHVGAEEAISSGVGQIAEKVRGFIPGGWKVALAAAALCAPSSLVGAVVWDYEFDGVELLDAPWTVVQPARMETDPPATWLQIYGSQGDAYVENTANWTPGVNSTVEFSFTLLQNGAAYAQSLYVFAGTYNWNVKMNNNVVNLQGDAGGQGTSALAAIGYSENLYRLVVTGAKASLYLNDNPTPVIANVTGGTNYNLTQLWVGDWGGAVTGDGQWNSIRWNNTQAIAPIPEPGTVALLLGGLGLIAWRSVRRSRVIRGS